MSFVIVFFQGNKEIVYHVREKEIKKKESTDAEI